MAASAMSKRVHAGETEGASTGVRQALEESAEDAEARYLAARSLHCAIKFLKPASLFSLEHAHAKRIARALSTRVPFNGDVVQGYQRILQCEISSH